MRSLRQKTLAAIGAGGAKRRNENRRERRSLARSRRVKVRTILNKIPETAYNAALFGEKFVEVMSHRNTDESWLNIGGRQSRWWLRKGRIPQDLLTGIARIVFVACVKAGLKPRVHTEEALGISRSLELVMIIPARRQR